MSEGPSWGLLSALIWGSAEGSELEKTSAQRGKDALSLAARSSWALNGMFIRYAGE